MGASAIREGRGAAAEGRDFSDEHRLATGLVPQAQIGITAVCSTLAISEVRDPS